MDTKAAFEKWLISTGEYAESQNGIYLSPIANISWDAWQASRDAIAIPSSSDSEYWFEGTFQRMRYERDVEKAIGSGIRIKGKTE